MNSSAVSLLGLSIAILAGTARGEDDPKHPPKVFTLRPAPAPVPALKYVLLPTRQQQVPGNAAIFYHRAIERLIEIRLQVQLQAANKKLAGEAPSRTDAVEGWFMMPIAELPREELRKYLDIYRFCLEEAELGAIREACDWGYRHRVVGFTLSISELQEMRQIGRLIVLKTRLEIADGRFDSAVHWLQTGFAVAGHVNHSPILISSLIGASIVDEMTATLQDFVQAAGAPNLYWALANLPRPFLDITEAMEGERSALEQEFPQLRTLESGVWSIDQARAFAVDIQGKFGMMLNGWGRPGGGGAVPSMEDLGQHLVFTAAMARSYPEAKRRLIAQGRPAATIESMPVLQVVALDSFLRYQEVRDDLLKWAGLSYWQGTRGRTEAEKLIEKYSSSSKGGLPFVDFLPPLGSSLLVPPRIQRKIDVVQIVEAIRLYSANHDGEMPSSLDSINEAPVPFDPVTGKAYEYVVEAGAARLTAPAPPGLEHNPGLKLNVVIKVSR